MLSDTFVQVLILNCLYIYLTILLRRYKSLMPFLSINKKFMPPRKFKCKQFSHPWWKSFANKFSPSKEFWTRVKAELALRMLQT